MIKLVAFDLDGTIGDTIPLCIMAFRTAVKPYTGYELTEKEIIQTFGLNEEGMIKQVITNENWNIALNDFYTIYKENHGLSPHPFAGIKELIKELKKNFVPVVLITGKGKKSCEITLQQFALQGYFDRVETGSSEKNRKSEAIKNVLDCYNLYPYEMVYIGDTVSDIKECNKSGIKCFSAAWGADSSTIQELKEHNHENVFYTVELLRNYLMKNIKSTKEG